jgi:agmatine deiminase
MANQKFRPHGVKQDADEIRRQWLKRTALGALPWLGACGGGAEAQPVGDPSNPEAGPVQSSAIAEDARHQATYMAFATGREGIWSQPSTQNAGLTRVRQDLMDVAKAIGRNEPVVMMVVASSELAAAQQMLATASPANPGVHAAYAARSSGVGGVSLLVVPNGFNDYWTRDTGPVFGRASDGSLVAVQFNFNGWGNANSLSREAPTSSNGTKMAAFFQPFALDATVAPYIATRQAVRLVSSSLVLEGGALELDGEGTALATASSILHPNRNPQLFDLSTRSGLVTAAQLKPNAKATVAAELRRVLGVSKIIWLTGTAAFPSVPVAQETDITNGHVDFYAKFIAPGVVAVAQDPEDATGERDLMARHRDELVGQTDARGRSLSLVLLRAPSTFGGSLTRDQQANFAAGYLNFYVCNGALILPKFGDAAADAAAVAALTPYRGDRQIVQLSIDGIASGGGGLHCATTQVPA